MDYKAALESVSKCKYLPQDQLRILCDKIEELLCEESNVVPVSSPVVVCGDIHGQFFDLLTLFKTGGNPAETKYIFMGDYVDRGYNGLETITYLLLLKAIYPNQITLLRGNHESRGITRMYGFYDECILKYGTALPWTWFMEIFDLMSVSALIDGRIFCVHGGLSPEIKAVDQIRSTIQRQQEIPHTGPFCDLMWSDPEEAVEGMEMSTRGAGYLFGAQPVKKFSELNRLELICRAHQLVQEGFQYMFNNALVTVWSAPNYCYRCGNVASVLCLDEKRHRDFRIFECVPEAEQINSAPQPQDSPYFL